MPKIEGKSPCDQRFSPWNLLYLIKSKMPGFLHLVNVLETLNSGAFKVLVWIHASTREHKMWFHLTWRLRLSPGHFKLWRHWIKGKKGTTVLFRRSWLLWVYWVVATLGGQREIVWHPGILSSVSDAPLPSRKVSGRLLQLTTNRTINGWASSRLKVCMSLSAVKYTR